MRKEFPDRGYEQMVEPSRSTSRSIYFFFSAV